MIERSYEFAMHTPTEFLQEMAKRWATFWALWLNRTSLRDLRTPCRFRVRDSIGAPQLRKGGTSVMRYEFDQLNKAMIGALQDCLLSARPR
jgi:hypothetical protein